MQEWGQPRFIINIGIIKGEAFFSER